MFFPSFALLEGLLMILTHVIDTSHSSNFDGQLPDLSFVPKIFRMFMKPYLATFLQPPAAFRTKKESVVEKVIKRKLEQLKPFLQDNDFDNLETDNRFTFEGNDETTIIEFIPQVETKSKTNLRDVNDTFKSNMKRYKKIRQKISMALEKEEVSDETKTLVINTFDELISKMVETQCNWKTGTDYGTQKNNNNYNRIIIPRTILDAWRTEFKKFKTDFSTLFNQRAKDPLKNMDSIMSYLNSMNVVINDISNNIETFTQKYKVSCNISERNDWNKLNNKQDALKNIRLQEDFDNDKDACKYFKVCSKELKRFLTEFYMSLNDTTINVLRSYAEMFTRDVYTDISNEKDYIVTLLFNIADIVEKGIIKTFVNDTVKFKVDKEKNKRANIILLSDYVRNVINHTKEIVSRVLENKLRNVPEKVHLSVQQDLVVNLGVDLGNLEIEVIGKICLIFNVCNNKTKSRRQKDLKKGSGDDETKIFVQVELTLAEKDEDKNNLLRRTPKLEGNSSYDVITTTRFDPDKYANITVTRTTLA